MDYCNDTDIYQEHKSYGGSNDDHYLMEVLCSKGIWLCRDGGQIKISAMSDSHLRNTINLLKRKTYLGDWTVNYLNKMKAELERRTTRTVKRNQKTISLKGYGKIKI